MEDHRRPYGTQHREREVRNGVTSVTEEKKIQTEEEQTDTLERETERKIPV